MRIVYFLPDIEAGVSRIVKNLLQYRPMDEGIHYAVVLFRRDDQQEQPVLNDFYQAEVIRFGYKSNENAYAIFKRLSKTLNSDNDIIVGNDGLEIKMVVTMRLLNPVVYILHGDFNYYYSIISNYHAVIDRIICYSNRMENGILQLGVVEKSKLQKLYYPIGVVKGGIPRSKNVVHRIVYAGSLVERKGADLLPEIYENLMKVNPNFYLQVIGEGKLMPYLKRALGQKRNVSFDGWLEHNNVQESLRKADIFLFPSRQEGLPNVVLEALSAGAVPVAVAIDSGIPDVVTHQINALLTPHADAKGLADCILELLEDSEKLERLRNNSHISLKKFDSIIQASAYHDLIKLTSARKLRFFPKYKRGRFLDLQLLPTWLVEFIRNKIKNPKL